MYLLPFTMRSRAHHSSLLSWPQYHHRKLLKLLVGNLNLTRQSGHARKLTMLCTWYFILLKLKLKCLLMLYVRIMHPGTLYVRYQGVFGNAASTMSCICPGGKWLLRYVRGVGNGMALCTLYGDRYALRESYGRLVSLLTLRRNF